MKILLLSALYPPDIAQPAPYIKELAKRLSAEHEVSVLTYAYLSEEIVRVKLISINKRRPLPLRLLVYTVALMHAMRKADIVYAENGASIELPLLIAGFLSGVPVIFHIGDASAHVRASQSTLLSFIERHAMKRAHVVLKDSPVNRPEILPLEPRPVEELAQYDASWASHMNTLQNILHGA